MKQHDPSQNASLPVALIVLQLFHTFTKSHERSIDIRSFLQSITTVLSFGASFRASEINER